jgi:hypothetical protein
MSGSDYIFCFQDKQNHFWKVDSSGKVVLSNDPYFLDFAPDGWANIAIQNIRNKRLWGVDRSVTLPLAYVQDAANILKYIFYTLGIEETVYLIIAKQTLDYLPGVNYGYWYKQLYKGEIDFSTFVHDKAKITCTTLEDGLPKYLKSNESTVYELPMSVPEAVNVELDGISTIQKANWIVSNGVLPLNNGQHIVPMQLTTIATNEGFLSFTTARTRFNNNTDLFATNQFFLSTDNTAGTTSITINYDFGFTCTLAPGITPNPLAGGWLLIRQFDTTTGLIVAANSIATYGGASNMYTHHHLVGSTTITALPNCRLFMCMFFTLGSGTIATGSSVDGAVNWVYDNAVTDSINADYKFTLANSYTLAFRPQYLFEKLIEKFTEGNYTAQISNYFKINKNIVFTCGNAIRNLKNPDGTYKPLMKISFKEFFDFWDCFDSVGISTLGNTINFDQKVNLIDNTDIIDLVEPSNVKISVAKEYLFNEVQIGYPDLDNELGSINGNDEFNQHFLFSLGSSKSPSILDKTTEISAACYQIEAIRFQRLGKDTVDYKNDNKNYVLHIDSNLLPFVQPAPFSYYKLDRTLNPGTTGLNSPETVFNLFLSPKRNLLRNGPFIHSSLYLNDIGILKYKSCDKNDQVISNGIIENADIQIGALGDRFFYPILIDMEVPPPENLLDLLDTNPLKIFRFPFYGENYYCLMVKASIEPAKHSAQNYQLMLLPNSNSDISKLINYYG